MVVRKLSIALEESVAAQAADAAERRGVVVPTVLAGVLAQGWRGGPQAQMSRLLGGCRVEDFDEARARSAGAACGATGTSDVVDAVVVVVVGAAARRDLVVTSDPGDLTLRGEALHLELQLEVI